MLGILIKGISALRTYWDIAEFAEFLDTITTQEYIDVFNVSLIPCISDKFILTAELMKLAVTRDFTSINLTKELICSKKSGRSKFCNNFSLQSPAKIFRTSIQTINSKY